MAGGPRFGVRLTLSPDEKLTFIESRGGTAKKDLPFGKSLLVHLMHFVSNTFWGGYIRWLHLFP